MDGKTTWGMFRHRGTTTIKQKYSVKWYPPQMVHIDVPPASYSGKKLCYVTRVTPLIQKECCNYRL